MEKFKRVFALLIAMVLVLAMGRTVFAAKETDSGKGGDASITITLPTDSGERDEEITYSVFKVFDATTDGSAISYKINSTNGTLTTAMTKAGFFVDDGGNVHYGKFTENENGTYMVGGKKGTITDKTTLSDDALAAIAAYATDKVGDFTAKPSDGTLKIKGLQYGYYYITTTTGALVTVDSTKPDAAVEDKNAIPVAPEKKIVTSAGFVGSIDDDGAKALAQVGTTTYFSADIVKVKGATNYVFHDTMSTGLSYNNDVAVTVADDIVSASSTINTDADDETFVTTTAGSDTITVSFDNDWLAALQDNTKITITYSATVTSDALSIDYANNTATLDYGDSHTTDKDEVKVYNAKITVSKQDGDGNPLAGAGFVIKNSEGKYYKIENNVVSWVDSIDEATMYTSDGFGNVSAFTGLADGTYTLVEKIVPSGYNKTADSTFIVASHNYTSDNLQLSASVVNNAGSTLPSTGGIGTTIFYVVGAILVVGAGVVLITRRRMSA